MPLAAALLTPLTAARFQANVVPEVLLAAVYVNRAPLVADEVKLLDSCGIAFTVNIAALLLTVPAVLVHTARYCLLLSAMVVVNDNVAAVAPVIFVQVVPFVLCCHCTVGAGLPLAAELKLTLVPSHFVFEVGWVEINGGVSAAAGLLLISNSDVLAD